MADGVTMALIDVNPAQDLYRILADSTTDLVALHDADSQYVYVSPSCEKLIGYRSQEILGEAPTEFCHPEDRKSLSHLFERVTRSGTYRVITKEGKVLWLEAVINPIKNSHGQVTGFQSSSRNVTARKIADDQLRESEFTIRTLLESSSQGILAVNQAGNIVLANLKAASMFGYRKSDFIGKLVRDLIPMNSRPQYQKKHLQFFRSPRMRSMNSGLNLSGLHKNGKEFPIEISLSSFQVNHETVAAVFVTDISKRKQSEAALLESHAKRLALSISQITAHDEASRSLARELHDVFSQELAALATESVLLKQDLSGHETAAAERVEGLAQRITNLAKDMHQMSRRLHPAVLDELGLPVALRAECNAFSQLHGIRTVLRLKQFIQSPKPDIALCLYRVTQESLRNVAKHSGTKTVFIDLAVKKGNLHLKIEDFGRGFDPRAHARKHHGLGLISMTERIRAVGGELIVDSQRGRGTIILAQVPLESTQ
jgi:PAS domain S-box-containing protein